jgi:hypothetical protein
MRIRLFKVSMTVIAMLLLVTCALAQNTSNTSTYGTITAQSATCTPTSCIYYQIPPNFPWVSMNITGTWVGTLQIQTISDPNATFQTINNFPWKLISTVTANQTEAVAVGTARFILVNAGTLTSGSVNVSLASSQSGSPLTNPVFSGQVTGTGLKAPDGGNYNNCWTTDGNFLAGCTTVAEVPVIRGSTSGSQTSGSSIAIPFPPGSLVGDLALLANTNCIQPTGWTLLYSSCLLTTQPAILSKVLTNDDIEEGGITLASDFPIGYWAIVTMVGAPTIRETDANVFSGAPGPQTITTSSAVQRTDAGIYFASGRTPSPTYTGSNGITQGNLLQTVKGYYSDAYGGDGIVADQVMGDGPFPVTFYYGAGCGAACFGAVIVVEAIPPQTQPITSYGLAVPLRETVAPPVQAGGPLLIEDAPQAAGTVFEGPCSGEPAVPTFASPCSGAGSGFPFTLGATSIGGSSTTTAVTGLEVNGVTLNAAGAATSYLDETGNYSVPAGGGGSGSVTGQAAGVIPLGTSATVIGNQSHLDDGNTTSGTITSTEPLAIKSASLPTQQTMSYNAGHSPSGLASSAVIAPDAAGNLDVNENNTGFARVCTATNGICPGSGGITALTGDVTASGTGSVAASVVRVNGASVPASQSCLGSNSSSQLIAGTCTGGGGGISGATANQPLTATGALTGTSYPSFIGVSGQAGSTYGAQIQAAITQSTVSSIPRGWIYGQDHNSGSGTVSSNMFSGIPTGGTSDTPLDIYLPPVQLNVGVAQVVQSNDVRLIGAGLSGDSNMTASTSLSAPLLTLGDCSAFTQNASTLVQRYRLSNGATTSTTGNNNNAVLKECAMQEVTGERDLAVLGNNSSSGGADTVQKIGNANQSTTELSINGTGAYNALTYSGNAAIFGGSYEGNLLTRFTANDTSWSVKGVAGLNYAGTSFLSWSDFIQAHSEGFQYSAQVGANVTISGMGLDSTSSTTVYDLNILSGGRATVMGIRNGGSGDLVQDASYPNTRTVLAANNSFGGHSEIGFYSNEDDFLGGINGELGTYSSAHTLNNREYLVDATGTTTITVPHALTGQTWQVYNTGSNTVTLACDSGNINGTTSVTLTTITGAEVHADGTNCWAVLPGTGTVTDGAGTTTANQVALSTTTAHQITYATGLPNGTTATTQTTGDNTTKVATDAFVIANAGSGGGSMVNITGSVTATGCAVSGGQCVFAGGGAAVNTATFSSIPGIYLHLKLLCNYTTNDSSLNNMSLQINGDTGSNYYEQFIYNNSTTVNAGQAPAQGSFGVGNTPGNSPGTATADIEILFPFYTNTNFYKRIRVQNGSYVSSSNDAMNYFTGRWQNTAAISSLTFFSQSGQTIYPGSACSLYGIN